MKISLLTTIGLISLVAAFDSVEFWNNFNKTIEYKVPVPNDVDGALSNSLVIDIPSNAPGSNFTYDQFTNSEWKKLMSPYYNNNFTWDGLTSHGTSQGFHSDTSKIGMTILNNFWNYFLYPNNLNIVETENSTIFSENCVGRVSPTGIYQGSELNTEYIYGLFAYNSDVEFAMLGYPNNFSIAAFAAVDNLIVASTILNFTLPQLNNYSLPIVVDTWMTYSWEEETFGLIDSYDAVFRNFDWYYNSTLALSSTIAAYQYFSNESATLQQEISNLTNSGVPIPSDLALAASQAAKQLAVLQPTSLNNTVEGEPSGPFTITKDPEILEFGTSIIKTLTANLICQVHETYCTGANLQYNSTADCNAFLETVRIGNGHEGGMNTVFCRSIHQTMVRFRPDVHCAHIGPGGGGMCTDGITFAEFVWDYSDYFPNMIFN